MQKKLRGRNSRFMVKSTTSIYAGGGTTNHVQCAHLELMMGETLLSVLNTAKQRQGWYPSQIDTAKGKNKIGSDSQTDNNEGSVTLAPISPTHHEIPDDLFALFADESPTKKLKPSSARRIIHE